MKNPLMFFKLTVLRVQDTPYLPRSRERFTWSGRASTVRELDYSKLYLTTLAVRGANRRR